MGRNHVHMAIGLPSDDGVISGMRKACEVVVEINMVKAMHRIPFYLSSNKVVLSEGPIPVDCFRSVIDMTKKEYIYEAPFDYLICVDFEATCCDQKPKTINS